MEKPIVSIITVCFNAEKTITDTIESVLNQTFTDYEYIVVDGLSTDSTYKIVCGYDEKFQEKGIRYYHISEKDFGVYDAMNKGTDLAQGMWVNFMNADDMYADDTVLWDVFGRSVYEDAHLLYGDVNHMTEEGKRFVKADSLDKITWAPIFSHQSTFIRREIQKRYRFREQYRIGADYDMLLRCYLDKRTFTYVPVVVADYALTGMSSVNRYNSYMETIRIQEDNGLIDTKSFGMRCKILFHTVRLKHEDNKVITGFCNLLIKMFSRNHAA